MTETEGYPTKAAVYDFPGDPNVLRERDIAEPSCPPDGVVIRVQAISIEGGDLIDRASTKPPSPGYVLGYAASGEIMAVGPEVHDRFVGQRVTSFDMSGSHAAMRAVKTTRTWIVPEGLEMAAATACRVGVRIIGCDATTAQRRAKTCANPHLDPSRRRWIPPLTSCSERRKTISGEDHGRPLRSC
ncbi:alcohol dehydrogenase catalytic domain-containing protein [Neorhizobium sp. DT-125]|uniref:alcohol dehydrogenase catalytic domain-containing protein n=1 Tax=Neorhizobium sp. DT-125 TaxID=3396163 RepID=UPI003F1E1359